MIDVIISSTVVQLEKLVLKVLKGKRLHQDLACRSHRTGLELRPCLYI